MRIMLTMTCLLVSLAGCATAPLQQDPDQRFTQLAEQLWQAETALTASEPDRMPDMSPAALSARQQQRLKWQQQLQQVDVAKLSEQNQINHAILMYRLANDIDEYRFNAHLTPLTSESGFHTSVAMMLQRSALRQLADYENYLQKLATVPAYMQQQTDWMRQGLLLGITQPKAVLKGFEHSISSYITDDMTASVFYRPFMTKPDSISDTKWRQLQDSAQQIIMQDINPAYQAYYDFMVQDYIPGARDTIAASALADGPAFYQNRLEHYTTLKLTPRQVHDTGLAEVKRIRTEMQAIITQLDFAGSFADFIQFLRTDPQFYPQSEQELMRYAAWLSKQADAGLPRLFKINST